MKLSDLMHEGRRLRQLGIRKREPIKPDVDYYPDAEREPQAPNFAGMWIDHFNNLGNIREPLGSPMESSMSKTWWNQG
ncbi:MAG: hypothetical protein IPG71_09305 [bacterium]|jgi:hypothetical protein|nr:hypothetical protein [bacterium]